MGLSFVDDTSLVGERIAAYLATQAGAEESQSETPLHVLVVDDSSTYRASVEQAMRAAGHRVTLAEHGLTALGAALRDPPDVVLSDVNMPMMDGWQLVRILRSRPTTRAIPVVFLTTLSSEQDRIRGYTLGVADYVDKPFDPRVLAARVARVARNASSERVGGAEPSGLRGDIDRVSIASLLAFLEAERRSGVVVITEPSGDVSRVHVSAGMVARVERSGDGHGSTLERLFQALDLSAGRFEVTDVAPGAPAAEGSAVSIQHALLEHARRSDESAR
jgi:DNA-binding response OmpR family regulator